MTGAQAGVIDQHGLKSDEDLLKWLEERNKEVIASPVTWHQVTCRQLAEKDDHYWKEFEGNAAKVREQEDGNAAV